MPAALARALSERYLLERELGQGGMATVYLAHDLKHDRPVALKVLHPEIGATLGPERFLREIRIAAQLQHPHILAVFDSGLDAGQLWYTMPYIDGDSLRDRLKREGPLQLEEACRIAYEVAEALGFAHNKGVIHRDVKPGNILLSAGHALVADFGLARALAAAGGEKLTETGLVLGTPHYMSPEQATGSPQVDRRADVYSLGCVLYEMLAGDPPFAGATARAVVARHVLDAPPRLRTIRSSIPGAVESVILRALAKVPADRFQTAPEFAKALTGAREVTGRRIAVTALAILTIFSLGAAIGLLQLDRGKPRAVAATEGPLEHQRIAVLLFEDRSTTHDLGYLATGLTEALIDTLRLIRSLNVVPFDGVLPFRRANVSTDSIARALNVGTLVAGSVEQDSGLIRAKLWLVDGPSGAESQRRTLEASRTDILGLQSELPKAVLALLREKPGGRATAWILVQQAQEISRGADSLLNAADTAAASRELLRADSMLAHAEAMDRQWVTPVIKRGWLAYQQTDLVPFADTSTYNECTRRGLGYADRALELNPGDSDALELRGTLEYLRWVLNLEPDPAAAKKLRAQAEQDLRSAVTKEPTAAWAWSWLSHLLLSQGQAAEAKLAAQRSYEADPYRVGARMVIHRLFATSFDLDDQAEARRWCEEGRRRFPDFYRFTECRIYLIVMKGQIPDIRRAWQLLDTLVQQTPPNLREYNRLYGRMLVALALARAGLADSARAVAVSSRGDPSVNPTRDHAYYEALVRIQVGDRDEAIRLLGTFLAANPQMRDVIAKDESWMLDDLRDDPAFKRLLHVE